MNKNILLIGRNPAVLADLASALVEEGFVVETTKRVEQASQDFTAANFTLIAFGRGVDTDTNMALRASFLSQNPAVLFVNGLAPVIPLLVKQIKLELGDKVTHEKILANFRYEATDYLRIYLTIALPCQVTVELYRLDAVHQTRQETLISQFVDAGNHTFQVATWPDTKSTLNFLVAEVAGSAMAVLPFH